MLGGGVAREFLFCRGSCPAIMLAVEDAGGREARSGGYAVEVSTLFWDNGGVILTNGWDRPARQKAVNSFHLDWAEFEDRHELVLNAFETGKMTLDEYLRRVVFYRERPFTREQFKTFIFEQSQPFPESLAFLGALARTRRYLLASLNNESREINEYRIDKFKLRDYFEGFFCSCYLGIRKPDAGIYTLALQITHRAPEECVFIDDRGLNLECAREMGMHAIQFQSVAQLQSELARLGVTTNANS
jgi:putative hydrolase of the HAD superfamily